MRFLCFGVYLSWSSFKYVKFFQSTVDENVIFDYVAGLSQTPFWSASLLHVATGEIKSITQPLIRNRNIYLT